MKVHLFEFQEQALETLRTKVHQASTFASSTNPQAVVFSAPTGSGKTVMMTALFEDILYGTSGFEPQPDAVILWISDSPELNEQSKLKIERMSDRIHLLQLETIESTFDRDRLEGGKIYFINTNKLGSGTLLTKPGDGRQYPIWQTFTNTAKAIPNRFYVVIDEAHRGMNMRANAIREAQTLMQRFLLGHPETGLVKMPMVIGVSATPKRFMDLLTGANAGHDVKQVVIPADQVRESGLLKDRILIHHPDNPTSMELTLLQEAASRWAKMANDWKAYCHEEDEAAVRPILVVQVEDRAGQQSTRTDLAAAISAIEAGIGRPLEPLEPVHALHDETDLMPGGRRIRKLEASRIQDDLHAGVVFFKTSLSTGWDCPRAEVMMSFRRAEDHTYIAQLLGRMVRTPLARRIERDAALNDVHLFLPHFNAGAVQAVIEDLKNVEDVPPTETGSGRELVILHRRPGMEDLFKALGATTTYRVNGARAQSHIRRYLGLARGLTLDGLSEEAWTDAKSKLVTWMNEAIGAMKAANTFDSEARALDEVALTIRGIQQGASVAEPLGTYTVEASDADIERFFEEAGRRLGNGLHKDYWCAHADQDPREVKIEAAVLARHGLSMDGLMAKSEAAFNALYDQFKKKIGGLKEVRRAYYERWRLASAKPADVPWYLPDTIDFRRKPTDPTYDMHLYLEEGGTFRADLGTWEREVLQEELGNPAVRGWLRNCDRKPWSLEIPYAVAGEIKPMFPDLVVVRQEGEDFAVDILEPHDSSLADNCDKARGLAEFAKKHGHQFGRIELIRKLRSAAGTEQYYRLDMNRSDVQAKVLLITTNAQLNQLFEELT